MRRQSKEHIVNFLGTSSRSWLCAIALLLSAFMPAVAQDASQRRIAVLASSSADKELWNAFLKGMQELGWTEGRNLLVDWRSAEGDYAKLPGLARELVARNPEVLVTATTPGVTAARSATSTIPIVMATIGDPVGAGFVKSLSNPGGNVTGVSNVEQDVSEKLIEFLTAMSRKTTSVAILHNPANPSHKGTSDRVAAAAKRAGISSIHIPAENLTAIQNGLASARKRGATGLIVLSDSIFRLHAEQISRLAIQSRMPSACFNRELTASGCLLSYGPSFSRNFHRSASYVDRILKGAHPATLPVELSNEFDLVINRRTARTLALALPPEILVRATGIID